MTHPTAPPLGRLTKVDLRQAWISEPGDFTPWLAQPENIVLLGEAIGIELEVESQEKSVGPFRADILCRDTTDRHYVLIENQLERTDHTHLGQLLTYAAGLDAVTIVWVAARFTDEHRAALDWLNRATTTGFNFFGLEVELWQIGNSPFAPKFNVVSQPNDWSRTVQEQAAAAGEMSAERAAAFRLLDAVPRVPRGAWQRRQDDPAVGQHWTNAPVGRSTSTSPCGTGCATAGPGVQFEMTGPDAKAHFGLLEQRHRTEVDAALSRLGPVEWRPHARGEGEHDPDPPPRRAGRSRDLAGARRLDGRRARDHGDGVPADGQDARRARGDPRARRRRHGHRARARCVGTGRARPSRSGRTA